LQNLSEFILIESQWLLTEHVLSGLESGHDLAGVKMVAGSDDDSINVGIIKDFVFVSSAVAEAEFITRMVGGEASGGTDTHEFNALDLPHGREEGDGGKVTGTQQAYRYTWHVGTLSVRT
jgi:hypothetical protein